jgi:hypothetical protein
METAGNTVSEIVPDIGKTSYRRHVNANGCVVDAPQSGALGTMRCGGGRQPSSTSTVRGWEAMPAFVS